MGISHRKASIAPTDTGFTQINGSDHSFQKYTTAAEITSVCIFLFWCLVCKNCSVSCINYNFQRFCAAVSLWKCAVIVKPIIIVASLIWRDSNLILLRLIEGKMQEFYPVINVYVFSDFTTMEGSEERDVRTPRWSCERLSFITVTLH